MSRAAFPCRASQRNWNRPRQVTLRFQDLTGAEREETTDGFHAVCIQHEIDQLDGIFWIKRLSKLKRDRLIRKWEKTQR